MAEDREVELTEETTPERVEEDRPEARDARPRDRDRNRDDEDDARFDDEEELRDRDDDEDDDDRPRAREYDDRGGRPGRDRTDRNRGGDRDRNDRGGRSSGRDRNESRREQSDKGRPGEDYSTVIRFDRSSRQFIAHVVEFPDLKATGSNKDSVIRDIEERLEDHISDLKREGRKLPEAIQSRRYPERLEVRVSQNLQRRLDLVSRQEKVGLDQLVTELLTNALDRRSEPPRGERQGGGGQNHGNRHGGNQQQQQRHPQHGGRRGGRNFHETMESRENFMEYVRNLEKGNFKKGR